MEPNMNLIDKDPLFKGSDSIEKKFENKSVTIGKHTLIKLLEIGRNTKWMNSASTSRKSETKSSFYVPISSLDFNHSSIILKSLSPIHFPHLKKISF